MMFRPLLLALAACALLAAPARAASPVDYLRGAQNSDGGFGMTHSGRSEQFATGWALLGLAAAGHRPGPAALNYVRRGVGSLRAIGDIQRTILVVRAARQDPRRFGGRDLLAQMLRHRRSDGSFDGYVSYSSFAVLALRRSGVSARSSVIRRAARWIERHQNRDGGFNVAGRGISTIDDTAYAVQALAAAGKRSSRAARRAVAFLASTQSGSGGWPLSRGGAPNSQSTAYAIQALVAARAHEPRIKRGQAYLRSMTESNGLVRYSRTGRQTPVWVTAQALMALHRRTF
jgi:hypothetical protein